MPHGLLVIDIDATWAIQRIVIRYFIDIVALRTIGY
jgi:hypothetical protein